MSLPTSKSWDETILRDPSNPNHSGIPWQFLPGSKGWRELQKIINFLAWGLSSREINQGETGVFFNVFVFVVFPPSLDVLFQESWYNFSEFRAYVAAKSHYEEFHDFNFFFCFIFFSVSLWWVFEVQVWLQEFNPSQFWLSFWPMVSLLLIHFRKRGKMGKK